MLLASTLAHTSPARLQAKQRKSAIEGIDISISPTVKPGQVLPNRRSISPLRSLSFPFPQMPKANQKTEPKHAALEYVAFSLFGKGTPRIPPAGPPQLSVQLYPNEWRLSLLLLSPSQSPCILCFLIISSWGLDRCGDAWSIYCCVYQFHSRLASPGNSGTVPPSTSCELRRQFVRRLPLKVKTTGVYSSECTDRDPGQDCCLPKRRSVEILLPTHRAGAVLIDREKKYTWRLLILQG
jgi:hypothetical protein